MDSPLFDCSGMVSQNHFQMLVERAWQVVQHEPWVMTGYIHIADTFEDDKFPCLPTVMCIHVGVASCQKQSGALRNDQFSVYEMDLYRLRQQFTQPGTDRPIDQQAGMLLHAAIVRTAAASIPPPCHYLAKSHNQSAKRRLYYTNLYPHSNNFVPCVPRSCRINPICFLVGWRERRPEPCRL